MKIIKAWFAGILLLFILGINCAKAMAANQQIELKAGWNLISFALQPHDTAIEAVLNEIITDESFMAIWAYDSASKTWSTYPAPISGIDTIDHIVEVGKGYWLKVTRVTTLTIDGENAMAPGIINFVAGWNLVGFSTEEAKDYDRVFFNKPVQEIWTYDAASGQFIGVEFPAAHAPPSKEEFTQLEPGKGYWVKTSIVFSLKPALGTAMEGDKDVPPLLPDSLPGERILWSDVTPGDEDIGTDGYYDRPDTQRALTFLDYLNFQTISIYNTGSGILNWSAQIDEAQNKSWLKFMAYEEAEGREIPVEGLSGSVTTDTAIIKLRVDRTGLIPGDYPATITIMSNGEEAHEPVRVIRVHMNVATIEGDYLVNVQIDSINGKKADIHNPRLSLSLYNDTDGLKGIIDDTRTLLIPQRFYMTGQYYEANTNHFIVSGSFELPEGNMDNPYKVPLRRDITLIGDRSDYGDALLGPLDLKGEYRETIRNVLKEPIYLTGNFSAKRLGDQTIDSSQTEDIVGEPIPDDGLPLTRMITISEKMIITDVDITVNLIHPSPPDLFVSLRSPFGTEVILRDQSTTILGEITYDLEATPVDSLENFNGEMSDGDWTLVVKDLMEQGKTGSLVSWSLDIKGTRVYSITGTINHVGEGATVLLIGCGLSLLTTTSADETYRFDNLVNGIYQITIHKPGYQTISQEIIINGQDKSGITLTPEKRVAAQADFIFGPNSGLNPLTVDFADISPPEIFEQDKIYTYSWTFSKLVNSTPQSFIIRNNEGPEISHTFNQPGIYVVKMEIFEQSAPSMPIVTVDKIDQYIIAGSPATADGSYALTSLTTTGGGGWFKPGENGWYQEQENAFDSATFDIDHPPHDVNNPGPEDNNLFLGEANGPDPITKTNKMGLNNIIDGPTGDLSRHMHIYVNIGQPISGRSVSGNNVFLIGANP